MLKALPNISVPCETVLICWIVRIATLLKMANNLTPEKLHLMMRSHDRSTCGST